MHWPKAILFDVFGTVVDWRGSLIAELSKFGSDRGIDLDWPALVDAWRAAYRPSMDRVRSGAEPWANLDVLHRKSLDRLLKDFGAPKIGEKDRVQLTHAWHRLNPWPDAVAGLTRLKRRTVISTLSNGNVALLVNMAKHAGLPWDVVISAELFQLYKPDPGVYLGACRLLGLKPGDTMLVAAHHSDLAAAQAQGLKTGFVPRPAEYGGAQPRDFAAEANWDVVALDFIALAAAFKG